MSDRIRRLRLVFRTCLVVGLLGLAAEQAWRHGHDYVLPSKFRVLEPGRLYRGAWQKPLPMRSILRDYKIKTVIALAHTAEEPITTQEKALAEGLGVRWVHIPIYYNRHEPESFDETADRLERAAAILADPANQPVFFHCHHGVNRTSMTQIAYRTLYCGWTLEQANEEVAGMTGWKPTAVGTGEEFMRQFYDDRVLPRREAESDRVSQAPGSPRQ